ncbi:hypothetical protein [Aliiroseovarius crassostreae]|uniref:hypothetical protein n=1 Tax=Aliiroseovarius crassostreae TaxID=154981 RepID=UPI003C7E8F7D
MTSLLKKFADDEFGNAVIDWTVLGTGALMMAIAVVLTVVDPSEDFAADQGSPVEVLESANPSV